MRRVREGGGSKRVTRTLARSLRSHFTTPQPLLRAVFGALNSTELAEAVDHLGFTLKYITPTHIDRSLAAADAEAAKEGVAF